MAHVMGITIPAGWEIIYNKTLRMYDISVMCNVGKNPRWFPRKKTIQLKEITYLYNIAYVWGNFTSNEKQAWSNAAQIIGQHGYNLFVQDKSYRVKNSIAGNAVPSIYHQFTVGHINISAPATAARIAQYNIHKIYFPATMQISAKTNLVSAGPNPYCRMIVTWFNYVTGQTIEQVETIEIPLNQVWQTTIQSIVDKGGRKGRWNLQIELNDVTGDLWFDNPSVEYNGQVQINDTYCEDVVKWWKGENIPTGVTFETIYPTGGAI
jgi:hypothetical protein